MMMYVVTHDILLEQLVRAPPLRYIGLLQQEGMISVRNRRSSGSNPSGILGTGLN